VIHNPSVTHIGLIGAGNISETHARACREIPGVEIVAVHGANHARAGKLAALYGGVAYAELSALLAHRPLDAVIIGSPSGVHAAEGIAAARSGLHVLVEKPIEVTVAAADRLIDAARQARVRLGVLFQDRTQPSFVRLRELLASGALGRPLLASARVKWYRAPEYYTASRWRGTRALDGGGALINQGIHTIDLLVWLLGPVRRVLADSATLLHRIEVEDTALAILTFESGVRVSFEATTAAYPGYPRRVELTTTEGTVVLEHDRVVAADLRTSVDGLLPEVEPDANRSASSPVVSDVRGHQRLIQDFVAAIRESRDPLCSGVEGRRSVAIVEAIYESARTGCAVDVTVAPAERPGHHISPGI
jgi:UDP-N-acetyl-2-amino-2-deoxyglucuronate dehydrogenase